VGNKLRHVCLPQTLLLLKCLNNLHSLGHGAEPPKDDIEGLPRRKNMSSLDELRKQLQGKRPNNRTPNSRTAPGPVASLSKGPAKQNGMRHRITGDSSDDEEVGRSGTVSLSRRGANKAQVKAQQEEPEDINVVEEHGEAMDVVDAKQSSPPPIPPSSVKKRPTSFLDEVLAEKAARKKKKRKRNKGNNAEAT
jgi:hypothetical protein